MSRKLVIQLVAAVVVSVFAGGLWITGTEPQLAWLRFFSLAVWAALLSAKPSRMGKIPLETAPRAEVEKVATRSSRHLARHSPLPLDRSRDRTVTDGEDGVLGGPAGR